MQRFFCLTFFHFLSTICGIAFHISAASILSSSSVPHGITVHQGQRHSCCLCLMSRHLDDLTIFLNVCRSSASLTHIVIPIPPICNTVRTVCFGLPQPLAPFTSCAIEFGLIGDMANPLECSAMCTFQKQLLLSVPISAVISTPNFRYSNFTLIPI